MAESVDMGGFGRVKPRRVLAQHWLRSNKVLDTIVKTAECSSEDKVLEIGPGMGVLTRRLLPLVESLVAVELDEGLCKVLSKELGKRDNFLLLQGDFLSVDVPGLTKEFPAFVGQNKVVANIPYNITGPIIEKLLGTISEPAEDSYELIVLLVQKEVAERLTARPGSKVFGALTVRVQYLAECEYICTVPAGAFYPPPKVDSAVVKLIPRKMEVEAVDVKLLERLVKLGFSAKRKMLRNNLQSILDRDRVTELLEGLGINPLSRAEDISVEQWVNLSNLLVSKD